MASDVSGNGSPRACPSRAAARRMHALASSVRSTPAAIQPSPCSTRVGGDSPNTKVHCVALPATIDGSPAALRLRLRFARPISAGVKNDCQISHLCSKRIMCEVVWFQTPPAQIDSAPGGRFLTQARATSCTKGLFRHQCLQQSAALPARISGQHPAPSGALRRCRNQRR